MGDMALKPIHRVRLKNLEEVIAKRFKGNASEAARAIERSHTFVWQLLKGYRSIGEETARNIEAALKLGTNALDSKLERTKALVAQNGDGTATAYPMVPLLPLDQLSAKPTGWRPCPDPDASAKTFAAVIDSESMVEVQIGDIVFIEPTKRELVTGKLYLVTPKGSKAARVMLAKRITAQRWVFLDTAELAKRPQPLEAGDAQVIGLVILVMRHLR